MKKLHLLKTVLLLFALIVGSVNYGWATEVTYTFTSKSWAATVDEVVANWICGDEGAQMQSGRGVQVTTGASGANATSPESFSNISQIVVTYSTNASKGAGSIAFKVGNNTAKSQNVTTTGGTTDRTLTYDFNPVESGNVLMTITCTTNSIYVKSVKITYSSGPSISASDTNITFDATSGEFGYTLNNPVDGGVLSATVDVDWITDVAVNTGTNKVTFNTTANTAPTPRVGTITMTYKKDDETLATKEVTITQAKAVVMLYYSLATQVIPGRHYIITNGKAGDVKAMGAQTTNNRSSVDVSADNEKISVSSDDGVYEFVIAGDMATGYYTIYDTENTGYLYAASGSANQLKVQNELDDNGKWTISIDYENGEATIKAQGTNTRNWMRYNSSSDIFSCYGSGQADIYLFERDGDTSVQNVNVTINAACNDREATPTYYGTYSAPFAFVVPADLTVSAVSVDGGKLTVTNYETGNVVKANTGVMVSATSAGDKTVALSSETGTEISGNMLKASSVAMTGDNLFYRLTMHEGTQIGFWWGAANGAAFPIAANKAYLAVPEERASLARSFWFDEGETTSLREVRGLKAEVRGEYYNLNGQRVAQPSKGLYIVNGKKVMFK